MNGLLLVDKPEGMTSREIVDHVLQVVSAGRSRRQSPKVGHAGTLDPMATGLLVVCIGSATRLITCLHEYPKVYRARFRLGATSDTDDCEGEITLHPGPIPQSRDVIESVLPEFLGTILQQPPKFSAIKISGRRAYDLARQAEPVELAPRFVQIDRCDLLEFAPPELDLEIVCGSGTYIRSIARDLGERLGTGGLMSRLRRLSIGPCHVDEALSGNELRSLTIVDLRERLLPSRWAVAFLPTLVVSSDEAVIIRRGGRLRWYSGTSNRLTPPLIVLPECSEIVPQQRARVAIVSEQEELLAIAEHVPDGGTLQPKVVLSPLN